MTRQEFLQQIGREYRRHFRQLFFQAGTQFRTRRAGNQGHEFANETDSRTQQLLGTFTVPINVVVKIQTIRQREENGPRFFQRSLGFVTCRSIADFVDNSIPQFINGHSFYTYKEVCQSRICH